MLLDFSTSAWIKPLLKRIGKLDPQRNEELASLGLFAGDWGEWIRFYVEPRGRFQTSSPAPQLPDKPAPVFPILNAFLSHDTDRNLILLGEAGVGKSSLVVLLKLFQLAGFWPEGFQCRLLRAAADTPETLATLQEPETTILILDGLDEANLDKERRLDWLAACLAAAQRCHKIIVASDNRYFARNIASPDAQAGGLSIGGFDCSLLLLYGFDDEAAAAYLDLRYPRSLLRPRRDGLSPEAARALAGRLRQLRFRPLLLSRLHDFATVDDDAISEYAAYEAMVLGWLARESEASENEQAGIALEPLYELAKRIARLAAEHPLGLASEAAISNWLSADPERASLSRWTPQADSLIAPAPPELGPGLRFVHRSLQEFALAQDTLDSSEAMIEVPPYASERTLDFIVKGRQADPEHSAKKLVLRHMKLTAAAFEKADLKNAVLEGVDLRNASFRKADLRDVELRECRLEGADFTGAITTGARLDHPTPGLPYRFQLSESCDIELLWVAPGSFTVGELPSEFSLALEHGYWLGKHPVTQGQYEAVAGSNPSYFAELGPTAPVEQVSWQEAERFCRLLTARIAEIEGASYHFRLPTEVEWEFACRAGSDSNYSYGDDEQQLSRFGWSSRNSEGQTHEVGQKLPNAWGFHDMHGNVWEWCLDCSPVFSKNLISDLKKAPDREDKAIRGGSFSNGPFTCRSRNRNWYPPLARYNNLGFRALLAHEPPRHQDRRLRLGL